MWTMGALESFLQNPLTACTELRSFDEVRAGPNTVIPLSGAAWGAASPAIQPTAQSKTSIK
jgi:hypothetical protein